MSGSTVEKLGITQFAGKDYDHWKFRMEIILDEHEVKKCIDAERENPDDAFRKLDKKCKSLLIQCIANSHLEYVKEKSTSYQMWKALEEVFQRKGVATQLFLKKKLLTMKLSPEDTLEKHFMKFDETVRELKSVGSKLEESDIVCHLLLTLPKSFDPLVTALETLEPAKLTLEFVRGKLLDHEIKKRNQEETEVRSSAAFTSDAWKTYKKNPNEQTAARTPSFPFPCYNCGKIGHKRVDCRVKKQANQTNKEEESDIAEHIAFLTSGMSKENGNQSAGSVRFVVDSGATDHMVNSLNYFSEVTELKSVVNVSVAKKDQRLTACKIGVIAICVNDKLGKIIDVLFIKDLKQNLLSVQKLEKAGFQVTFNDGNVVIKRNSFVLAVGKRINNLYIVEFKINRVEANVCEVLHGMQTWHRRLGHLSNRNLMLLSNDNLVEGLSCDKNSTTYEMCDICVKGKMTKLPFCKPSESKSSKPLELVHSDLCGPIKPCTYDGKRYFVTFLDDYTHFSYVYLISKKSEVFECFKKYEALVTAHFGTRMVTLKCDNGKEYIPQSLVNFCSAKGIQIKYTIPYTPELNGKAERLNRTLLDKARTMMLESNLDKELWGESILCATYVTNRSPTTSLKDCTPAEMFFGKKPNLKNLRVFGCVAYRHIPKEKQKGKFNSRCDVCIMVGYTHNGYRLFNPETRKIIVARDVLFDETKTIKNVERQNVPEIRAEVELLNENRDENIEIDNESEVTSVGQDENSETKTDEEEYEETSEHVSDESDRSVERTNAENKEKTLRRSARATKKPARFEDYDSDLEALNAESFINNIPNTLQDAEGRPDYERWRKAVEEEIDSLERNQTWDLVRRPKNARVIGSKWVFRIKRNEKGGTQRYKARLVAKGFMQKQGYDYEETYAPVARLTTFRTLIAVINHRNLHTQQMDVKAAFLHGTIDEDIYMEVPNGIEAEQDAVCKLKKSLYGLKQAPFCWNNKFNEFAETQGLTKSESDACLYWKKTEEMELYLLLYVDDMIIASNKPEEIESLKRHLVETFEMQDLGKLNCFLGINVHVRDDGIYLSQRNYLEHLLARFQMSECKAVKTPMEKCSNLSTNNPESDDVNNKPVRELIGCLMYAMLATRPDLSASVNFCSRLQSKPTESLWQALKRILRYIKGTLDLELFFEKNNNNELVGFADSDWAGDTTDRKSTSGFMFKIFGGTVCWYTKKQNTVAISSTEAEYVALAEAAREGIWLVNLLKSFNIEVTKFTICEDNQSCIKLTRRVEHKRLKHVDTKFNFIRDLVHQKRLSIEYTPTCDQIADILTKNLETNKFSKLRLGLGLLTV